MNANTIELILKILEVAGPIIAQVPKLGAKWITNRNEVLAMVREGRNPTPEEHRRLTREMDSLIGGLRSALASAEMQALASASAEDVEAAVSEAAEADGVEVAAEAPADDPDSGTLDPADEFEEEVAVDDEATPEEEDEVS